MKEIIATLSECANATLRHFNALTGTDAENAMEDVIEGLSITESKLRETIREIRLELAGVPDARPKTLTSRFEDTERYACVSTAYVAESDLPLLLDPAAPGHVANHDEGYGSYFYIPTVSEPADDKAFEDHITECFAFGFSPQFVKALRLARVEDIAYVNFDADGGAIEGMEPLQP